MKTAEHTNVEAEVPKEDSKPPAKRPRLLKSEEGAKKSDEHDDVTPIAMNYDAMVNVMEFLPPRSLFNVAMTCKSLRSKVTTKMVVHSALIHGKNARYTMEELYRLIKKHSIHVPSPLRLLRLANAKRCEFCPTGQPKGIRHGLGVYACWRCLSGACRSINIIDDKLTEPQKPLWKKYPTLLNHPRIASDSYGKDHPYWIEHRSDASGEMIGPLVTSKDIDDMISAVSAADEVPGAEEEEVEEVIVKSEWIENYLTKNLNVPAKEHYAEFIECYRNCIQKANQVSKERKDKKNKKRADAKKAKVPKVKKMLDDLTALIDEQFRECAMKRYEDENYLQEGFPATDPCMSMETAFINYMLEPYIKSPSKMNKKTRKEVAEKINFEIDRIKKLWEMDFLSDDDDFQAAAKAYFRKCFPTVESMFTENSGDKWYHNVMCTSFITRIDEGRFLEALYHLKRHDLSPLLPVTEPSASLVREKLRFLDDVSLKNLAKYAWEQGDITIDYRRRSATGNSDSWVDEAMCTSHKILGEALEKVIEFKCRLEKTKKCDTNAIYAYLNRVLENRLQVRRFMFEKDMEKLLRRAFGA